jgi:hypothetical protein
VADESMSDLERKFDQAKRDYWNELVAADEPDAVELHDQFCAELDKMLRDARETSSEMERDYEDTRQAMMNVVIAFQQGDVDEASRLVDEYTHRQREA